MDESRRDDVLSDVLPRCPNFSLTLRHPACYDLPRAILLWRSPRQSRCLSSNPRRPRFVVRDVEASGSGVRLADVVCTVMLMVCTVMLVSVFARAWSECEQRTWGVWRRGTPTSHRRQVVSLAVSCAPESPLSYPFPMSLGSGFPRRGCEVVSDSRWCIPHGILWAHPPSRTAAQHPRPPPPGGNGNRQPLTSRVI